MSWDGDPPEEVLLELGRLAWAAINLEDIVYAVCGLIRPPFSTGPVGSLIADVRKHVAATDHGELGGEVDFWLVRAAEALESRNAVLHSTPATAIPLPGTTVIQGVATDWLTHFPRSKVRSVVHTALTVEALAPVRIRIQRASDGWTDVVERWSNEHKPFGSF